MVTTHVDPHIGCVLEPNQVRRCGGLGETQVANDHIASILVGKVSYEWLDTNVLKGVP